MLTYDNTIWEKGVVHLCGIDEAGRGPLAGPVVAGAVILPVNLSIHGLDDSKKLTAEKRLQLEQVIKSRAVSWSVAQAGVEEIDRMNILQATFLAMRRALLNLEVKPDFLLVDGRDFPAFIWKDHHRISEGLALIGGDGQSASIAAASVLAKVHRDRLMERLAETYPGYGFEEHKGYGTERHRRLIRELGPCPIHRRKFIRNTLAAQHTLEL